jgi:hypothetical protein
MTEREREWQTLVGVFDRPEQLDTARNLLIGQGIEPDQIATLARPVSAAADDAAVETERAREEPAKATTTAAAGAAVGTTWGLVTLGPLFPAATAAGGLVGWLMGLGIPASAAEEYHRDWESGQQILLVRVRPSQAAAAERVLRQAEAKPAPPRVVEAAASEMGGAARSVEPADGGGETRARNAG